MRLFILLLIGSLLLNACKKDLSPLETAPITEGGVSTLSKKQVDEVDRWLNGLHDKLSNKGAKQNIASLKQNLIMEQAWMEELSSEKSLLAIPIKTIPDKARQAGESQKGTLILWLNKEGRIVWADIIDYTTNTGGSSALPKNALRRILKDEKHNLSGKLSFYSVFSKLSLTLKYQNGNLQQLGHVKRKTPDTQNASARTGGNCFHYYQVITTYENGLVVSQEWNYMYSVCDDTNTGGGGGTGNGSDGNDLGGEEIKDYLEDPEMVVIEGGPAIDLAQLFKCFENVSSNGATYKIKICADLPVNGYPYFLFNGLNPGHTFITLTKSSGSQTVSQSFGFYPKDFTVRTVLSLSEASIMNDNGGHEYEASFEISISQQEFAAVQQKALNETKNLYDLNDYNCTDYALEVINFVQPNNPLIVQDRFGAGNSYNYGTTPNKLYERIKELASLGYPQATLVTANSPTSLPPCQ